MGIQLTGFITTVRNRNISWEGYLAWILSIWRLLGFCHLLKVKLFEIIHHRSTFWASSSNIKVNFESKKSENLISGLEIPLPLQSFQHYFSAHLVKFRLTCLIQQSHCNAGADPEILKRGAGGALCRPPGLADKENFRFQMV